MIDNLFASSLPTIDPYTFDTKKTKVIRKKLSITHTHIHMLQGLLVQNQQKWENSTMIMATSTKPKRERKH
jgi:hypothetical protein